LAAWLLRAQAHIVLAGHHPLRGRHILGVSNMAVDVIDALRAHAASREVPQGQTLGNPITRDLLSVLLATAGDSESLLAAPSLVADLVSCIRREDYSITNLFTEICALKRSFSNAHTDDDPQIANAVSNELDAIFDACLRQTSLMYEIALESTLRGFCEIDPSGHLRHANAALRKLLDHEPYQDLRLIDVLEGEESFIENALAGRSEKKLTRMHLRVRDQLVPVGVEFGQLYSDGKQYGAYAVIVDISTLVRAEYRAYELSALGFLKYSSNLKITFANDGAAKILGYPSSSLVGMELSDIFPPEAHAKMHQELAKRAQGRASQYSSTIRRGRDGKTIPVQIDAMPEQDDARSWSGTLVVLQSLEMHNARNSLRHICAFESDSQKIIGRGLDAIRSIIDFELATFSIYTKDMHFARVVHFYPTPDPAWGTRWFYIDEAWQDFLRGNAPWIDDLSTAIEETRQRGTEIDPVSYRLINDGYRSILCCRLFEGDRVVALLALISKEPAKYDSRHHQLLMTDLDVETLLRAAAYAYEREETDLVNELVKEIDRHNEAANELIVRRLSDFYGWQNVALFRVHGFSSLRIELVEQAAGPVEGFMLRVSSDLLESDCLGPTLRRSLHKKATVTEGTASINAPTIKTNNRTAAVVVQSQLCSPIKVDQEVCWLLSISDTRRNAFAEPEIKIIERIVLVLEGALERAFHTATFESCFSSASEGIFIIDSDGVVHRCNDSGAKLLQVTAREIEGQALSSFVHDPAMASSLASSSEISQLKTEFTDQSGRKRSVLVSGNVLVGEHNRKVLFVQDLSEIQLLGQLKAMQASLNEIISEARIPLAFANSMLHRIGRVQDGSCQHDVMKAISYLDRAELTYDRALAALDEKRLEDQPFQEIPLMELIRNAIEFLDLDEASVTVSDDTLGQTTVQADAYQLGFVLKSILTYLGRDLGGNDRIEIALSRPPQFVTITVSGPDPSEEGDQSDPILAAEQSARSAMALAEPVLKDIVERRHGGRYSTHRQDRRIAFELALARSDGQQNVRNTEMIPSGHSTAA